MTTRMPAVAGAFYPSEPPALEGAIRNSYLSKLGPGELPPSDETTDRLLACVCPHAGYEYSGPVAAHSYRYLSSLRRPELVVVVGPNHYGVGSGLATSKESEWLTPLGRVPVDSDACKALAESAGVDRDTDAHKSEHSIEVQLPFLQQLYGSFPFVPVSMAFQDLDTAKALGKGLAGLLEQRQGCLLIASSDLTHYEPASSARKKDLALLKFVEALDVPGFYAALERMDVTACGYGPVASVMEACRLLGYSRAETLKYATSGDSTGDQSSVVGYSSVRFLR